LITDVSWNFRVKKKIKKFKPRPPDAPDGTWRMQQQTSIACRNFGNASSVFFARTCATSCAIIGCTINSSGPRFLIHVAALEMHPLDTEIGSRNCEMRRGSVTATSRSAVTRSAREALKSRIMESFPLKERVVDDFYDPFAGFGNGSRKSYKDEILQC
jgi:succinate dehydrogenase / fumarate reductase iron-sulfur subunit